MRSTISKILLSLSLLVPPALVGAQPAADYFHRGAQFYIFGDKSKAANEVQAGLRVFPDDAQLQALAGLLAKEEPPQPPQPQPDQSGQDQRQQPPENQKPQEQQQQQDSQQEKAQPQAKQSPDQPQDKDQPRDRPQDQSPEQQPVAAGQMTPEEAKRLLDAQKREEQLLQFRPDAKAADRRHPFKDW